MGEAKRRKQLDPNYGKVKSNRHRHRQIGIPLDWKRIQKPTTEELELYAGKVIPAWLASGFSQALDKGIEILPSANLPRDWHYRMRCVEFYPPAMDWVRREVLDDASLSPEELPLALINACKLLGTASILFEQVLGSMEAEIWD